MSARVSWCGRADMAAALTKTRTIPPYHTPNPVQRMRTSGLKRVTPLLGIVFFVTIISGARSEGALLTGAIEGLLESTGTYYWGDGINDLHQEWSVNSPDSSGWFYGSTYGSSNADVYVYSGLSDVSLVTDASVFDYWDSSSQSYPSPYGLSWAAWAEEGDTVFFKGTNGYYGAWYIIDIYYDPMIVPCSALNGIWCFLDDGSSDFSVPEPTTLSLFSLGVFLLERKRRIICNKKLNGKCQLKQPGFNS